MSRILIANVLVWNCVMGLSIGATQSFQEPMPAPPKPTEAVLVKPGEILTLLWPALGDYGDVRARPLFSPGRRPPATPKAPEAAGAPPAIRLVGVFGATDALRALVMHPEDGVIRLARGDRIEGWTVIGIDLNGLDLRPPNDGDSPVHIGLGEDPDETAGSPEATSSERSQSIFAPAANPDG